MKISKLIYPVVMLSPLMLAGCADTGIDDYQVEKPQTIAEYEYLNAYEPLKTYVDRSAHPNFKVSGALTAADFNNQGTLFRLAAHNFDEIVAGNAMKMSSCVDGNGNMNFSTVSDFVEKAEEAGITVYGHTLAWHAQQPKKWLEKLIADKEIPGAAKKGYIQYNLGEKAGDNNWDKQGIYTLPKALEKGATYTMTLDAKASDAPCTVDFWPIWDASANKNQWGGSNDVQYLGFTPNQVGENWTTLTCTFTASFPHDKLQIVFGKGTGTLKFTNLVLTKEGSDDNLIANAKFEDGQIAGWGNNYNGPSYAYGEEGGAKLNYFMTYNCGGTAGDNSWDKQAIYTLPKALTQGKKYVMTMKAKSTDGCHIDFWPIWDASANKNQWGGSNDVQYLGFTPSELDSKWQTVTCEFTASFPHDKLQLVFGKATGKVSFDDLVLTEEGSDENLIPDGGFDGMSKAGWANNYNGPSFDIESESQNSIPLTDKEKKDTLTWAMDKWIGGMMDACKGKVKAWDVVNEAISGGGNDGEGFYALQHGATANNDNGVSADFFWQDYLGDIDYVRTAVALARKNYAASLPEGADASDLKLFVNDYNLESNWDDNKKLKSLINWVKKWEADGVTKIDGLGTQMHISLLVGDDEGSKAEQNSRNEHIEKMFKLMAESGKLVRVSELDLGVERYVDGKKVAYTTEELEKLPLKDRLAIEKAMAAHYQWIIKKYYEIVPAAQQYGICQWCLTDSPANSSWRKGEPVGLWTLDYRRKPAYAGWADGLSNK